MAINPKTTTMIMDTIYHNTLFLNLLFMLSIIQMVRRLRAKVNMILFQFGWKIVFDVKRSKGTSAIKPKSKRVKKYLFLSLVLKKPSTTKNINNGNAIQPKIENRFDRLSKNPFPSRKGVIKLLLT